MQPDRAQFQTMNRLMIERIGTMPHAPLVENGSIDGDGPFTVQRSTGRDAAPAARLYCRAAEGVQSRFSFPPDADLDAVLAALPQMAVFELTGT